MDYCSCIIALVIAQIMFYALLHKKQLIRLQKVALILIAFFPFTKENNFESDSLLPLY